MSATPYTAPQSAQIITTTPVVWSNASLFSGYILLGTMLPTNALGTQYAQVKLWGVKQDLPLWQVIPIVQGQVDTNTTVFWSTEIDPPNSQYVAYWYDSAGGNTPIYPPANSPVPTPFTISASPYTITQPTLTVPGVAGGGLTPAPQVADSITNTSQVVYAVPSEVTLTGTANGVNTVFTLPATPLVWASIFTDGQKQDSSTYTRTGATVTFVTAPTAGASITGQMI